MSDEGKAVQLLGEVLGALAGPPGPRPTWCGGAVILVDLETYELMAKNGTEWATPKADMPKDGSRIAARTVCREDVTQTRSVSGDMVQHGTCAACHGVEERFRIAARKLAGDGQKPR